MVVRGIPIPGTLLGRASFEVAFLISFLVHLLVIMWISTSENIVNNFELPIKASVNIRYESPLNQHPDKTTLQKKIKNELTKEELESIDVVIPIPDTSRTSALPLSIDLNIKLREGFVKNRYIGRTFIMPGQRVRKKSVKQKLNTIDLEFRNRNVILIDDSIVRGNTSKQIIQMARDAGAKKVYFASASPPIRFPNVYGIDMPYVNELVAHDRTVDQIKEEIGADKLIYQSLEDLVASVKKFNPSIKHFD